MKNASVASSSAKLSNNAKPKLKAWTTEIKSAIKIMRSKYKFGKTRENQEIQIIQYAKRKKNPRRNSGG